MKSQNHRATFYLCASILLFALVLAATPASAQSGGLNVLSMDEMSYSWSGEVQENAWTLVITQSSSGEQIYGKFNKEDIKSKDPITGEQGFATHDIEISMRTISTTCKYCIESKTWINPNICTGSVYTDICVFSLFGTRCNWNGSEIRTEDWEYQCELTGGDFRKNDKGWEDLPQVACFYETDRGTHGVLKTPTYGFVTEVIVTKKGDTQDTIRECISNQELDINGSTAKKSAYLGSVGYIEWVGNLASGESCPNQDLPNAIYNQATGWTLSDNDGYTQYASHYPSQWKECKDTFEHTVFTSDDAAIAHAENCAKYLNEKAGKALTPKTIANPVVSSTDIDGSIVRVNIKPGAIQSPTYKLILPASWLGVYVPKPEPSIGNIKSEWDAATSRGKFWVDVKNVGDEDGDFTYGMTCQYPAQVREPDRSDYWDKGEVKTVELSVTGAVSKETIATCTVHVYDTKYPDIRKEKVARITVIPISTPLPTHTTATSTPTPPEHYGGDWIPPSTSTLLLYVILGLLFTGIIATALLWRRGRRGSKTEATEPAESKNEQKEDTEKKRPSSSSAKWIAAIIILILILGLGFFVVTSLKQPEVLLKSVSVKGFESINLLIVEIPTEVIFSVVLEVYNPNFLGATVTDVEYDLYVNDVYVGKGSLPRSVTIPANDKTNVETEVSVSVSSSIQALVTTIQQGSATAKVNGNVYIGVPIRGSISVPFSEEQRLV